MIEGAERMTYLGMVVRDRGAYLLFVEGMLIIKPAMLGWGVMKHHELQRILGNEPPLLANEYDPWTPDGSSDHSAFSDSDDSPAATSSSSSGSDHDDRAGARSPRTRVRGAEDSGGTDLPEPDKGPDSNELGWYPCVTPLRMYPMAVDGWNVCVTAMLDDQFEEIVPEIEAGVHSPDGNGQPAVGVFVRTNPFGEPKWAPLPGPWCPVGDRWHQRMHFTQDVARALVASAKVSRACDLAAVTNAQMRRYRSSVGDDRLRALEFKGGILVLGPADDPMTGWIAHNAADHFCLANAEIADAMHALCTLPDAVNNGLMMDFQNGMPGLQHRDRLVMLIWSDETDSYSVLSIPAPHGAVMPTDATGQPDPHGLPEPLARQALQRARWAPAFDPQAIRNYASLRCGEWNVPALLGALRLLSFSNAAPGLLRDTWHNTLCPPLAAWLDASRAHEEEWLARGVIRQPIDSLLDLMHRDVRLRRGEVWAMCPVSDLGRLFDMLAPKANVAVEAEPQPELVEKLLDSNTGCLLLFQAHASARQSAVVVWNGQCWFRDDWISMNALRERIAAAQSTRAIEQLVAVVHLV